MTTTKQITSDLIITLPDNSVIHINPISLPNGVAEISTNRRTGDYRLVSEHVGKPHLVGFKALGKIADRRFYTLAEARAQ